MLQVALAIGFCIFLQSMFSLRRINRPLNYLDNSPLLLKDGKNILYDNLRKSKMTKNDLIAKLRKNNVHSLDTVNAVIFETSGNISVIHGYDNLDDALLANVRCP